MSIYMTEAEQLEVIKNKWLKIQRPVTVVLAVVLVCFSVYRYWTYHVAQVNQHASQVYEQMMLASSNQDNKALRSYANTLTNDYGGTVYADGARLTLAKYFVAHQQYAKARTVLDAVASHGKMPAMRQIAMFRVARILFAEKAYQDALDHLKNITQASYMPLVNELKGDVHAAMGQYKEAMSLYKKAANEGQQRGIGNPFLEMKTNDLALREQSSKAVRPVSQVA